MNTNGKRPVGNTEMWVLLTERELRALTRGEVSERLRVLAARLVARWLPAMMVPRPPGKRPKARR